MNIKLGWLRARLETGQQLTMVAATALGLLTVFFWHLGSLTKGLSPNEAHVRTITNSLHYMLDHPINVTHNFLTYVLFKLHHYGPFSLRASSALLAIFFIFCFYKVARSWFGRLTGWLATLLFATTPLVILAGRSATPEIMYLSPLVIAAAYFWLVRSPHKSRVAYLSLFVLTALCLYTPGTFWFLALAMVAIRPSIKPLASAFPKRLTWIGIILFLLILAPLVVALVKSPAELRTIFLIPTHFAKPLTVLKDIGWMFAGLVWHTAGHGDLQVGRLALLNVAQVALAAFGLAALWDRARAKCYGVLAAMALSAILAGLNNDFSLLLFAVAPVCILSAAGLRYLFIEWHSIFPRNPIPRILAITMMCAVVSISLFYGIRYSLVAWPNTVATDNTYVIK